MDVPLSRSDYFRGVAKEARIRTRNRYFEQNPILTDKQAALLARPGMNRWLAVGAGPIRGVYSQSGSFDDALFVVSSDNLWRVSTAGVVTNIGVIPSNSTITHVSMAATANIGVTRAFLFVTAGSTLMCYDEGAATPWFQVPLPNAVGTVSVAYIASYVVVVPAQGFGINGQFYWIEPGETTVDPLNFATAERAPDPISEVVVFNDQFWLPGDTTTEAWYFTGDIAAPVLRVKGIVFDRGAWEGTALQVKDSMIIVDSEGAVFQISGGAKRISRPDIEERIREAIQVQAAP